MSDPEIRWAQRFQNYRQALSRQRTLSELEQQVLVQAIEFTHELAWNVLRNAVTFSRPRSVVHVGTARVGSDRCEMRMRDEGMGIHPGVLPRIFGAFEQEDPIITRQFDGLGLGLAISRAFIEIQVGSIRAESAGQGQGATFLIELLDRGEDAASPTA